LAESESTTDGKVITITAINKLGTIRFCNLLFIHFLLSLCAILGILVLTHLPKIDRLVQERQLNLSDLQISEKVTGFSLNKGACTAIVKK